MCICVVNANFKQSHIFIKTIKNGAHLKCCKGKIGVKNLVTDFLRGASVTPFPSRGVCVLCVHCAVCVCVGGGGVHHIHKWPISLPTFKAACVQSPRTFYYGLASKIHVRVILLFF